VPILLPHPLRSSRPATVLTQVWRGAGAAAPAHPPDQPTVPRISPPDVSIRAFFLHIPHPLTRIPIAQTNNESNNEGSLLDSLSPVPPPGPPRSPGQNPAPPYSENFGISTPSGATIFHHHHTPPRAVTPPDPCSRPFLRPGTPRAPLLHIPKTSEYPPPAVRPSSTTITRLPALSLLPIPVPAHSYALEHPVPRSSIFRKLRNIHPQRCDHLPPPSHPSPPRRHLPRSPFPPIPTPWNTPCPAPSTPPDPCSRPFLRPGTPRALPLHIPSPCRSSQHPTSGMFQRWLVSPASKIFYTTYSFYSTTMRSSYSLLFTLFYKRNIPLVGCFLPSCTPPQKTFYTYSSLMLTTLHTASTHLVSLFLKKTSHYWDVCDRTPVQPGYPPLIALLLHTSIAFPSFFFPCIVLTIYMYVRCVCRYRISFLLLSLRCSFFCMFSCCFVACISHRSHRYLYYSPPRFFHAPMP